MLSPMVGVAIGEQDDEGDTPLRQQLLLVGTVQQLHGHQHRVIDVGPWGARTLRVAASSPAPQVGLAALEAPYAAGARRCSPPWAWIPVA